MNFNDKIYVAGHNGMVGSAFVRLLKNKGYNNLVMKSHPELDLTCQSDVDAFFDEEKPDIVILAAAKVGGINANMHNHVDFMMQNIGIEQNVINSAFKNEINDLLFLGSSCIYPAKAIQPIKEEYLLTGPLEPTNEGYALAKIVGLKACEYYNKEHGTHYIGVMPPNLYGINDNFDLETSHVVPALIRKMHESKINNLDQVEIWGTGKPRRELMYVEDMVDASLYAFEKYMGNSFINVGMGVDYTIKELAETIRDVVGFDGELYFNTDMPDGMFQKLLDVSKIHDLGWKPKFSLEKGLKLTYDWYVSNLNNNVD